ncbi:MAG: type II secretion system protein [Candidatus Omnitrophica bacterium]|nr:type II secretion system protein [Candidatus Omnitrophota bacterium]
MLKKRSFTITELLIVAVVFLAMIAVLMPFVRMAKARSRRMYCANNLRQIRLGLRKYAMEHKNNFPATLGELYPNYVIGQDVFDCPASKTIGTKDSPDYSYAPGLTEVSSGDKVIAQDKDGNHKEAGKHILRVNGSVEWVK